MLVPELKRKLPWEPASYIVVQKCSPLLTLEASRKLLNPFKDFLRAGLMVIQLTKLKYPDDFMFIDMIGVQIDQKTIMP